MSILKESFVLRNQVAIPKIGFGTAPLKGDDAYQAVKTALHVGYRHIDTAAIYLNEDAVGRAVKDSEIPREAVFITSKLDARIKSYDATIKAFHESLHTLNTDYLDLYLIHAPWPWDEKYTDHAKGNVAAFKALEYLMGQGLVRAIGVSNFDVADLENIHAHCDTSPLVNQIKYHIGHPQEALVAACKKAGILVEAYSPLGRAKVLEHSTLIDMADRYGVSVAQLCIRYPLEKGILPLPRSSKAAHIQANVAVDFTLKAADLDILDQLSIDSIEFGTSAKK